jgi:hypothetical protein
MRGAALPVLLVVQALRWGGQALRQGVGGGGGKGLRRVLLLALLNGVAASAALL